MKLRVNQLVKRDSVDFPDETETLRILWKDEDDYGVAVIDVHNAKALPVLLEAIELEVALLEKRAKILKEQVALPLK